MDPALRELLRDEPADRVVEAIIRLRRPHAEPPGVRIVARFGRIATCRLPLGAVREVWAHPDVVSLKAARPLGPESSPPGAHEGPDPAGSGARIRPCGHAVEEGPAHRRHPAGRDLPRRPPGLPLTGAGVIVG